MRIAHIADPHLGYRAYNRVNPAGLNAREADVFFAFRQALMKVVEIKADLILIAGDLFHVVRPSNLTIQHAFREFKSLIEKTNAPVVIIGGNHDTPRSADTGCILDLLGNLPGVHCVHSKYDNLRFEGLNTSVFCLCHRAIEDISSLKIEPDPNSKYNILMAHGTVDGIIRNSYDTHEISRSQVINDSWDYVAFGHYHIFEELAPNAYYAGSLEYTSTNIWSEIKHEKGFIEYDLDEHRLVEFHKTDAREVIDIRPIDAADVIASDLNKMIQRRIESVSGRYEKKIIRLVVENIHRSVQADLDYAFIRNIRADALHFDLQLRPPVRDGRNASTVGQGVGKSLEEEWDEFGKSYELPPGMDKEQFVKMGRDYLQKQGQVE